MTSAKWCGHNTTWTILRRQDGPNHLGLWYNVLPERQMALITSGCVLLQVMCAVAGATIRLCGYGWGVSLTAILEPGLREFVLHLGPNKKKQWPPGTRFEVILQAAHSCNPDGSCTVENNLIR